MGKLGLGYRAILSLCIAGVGLWATGCRPDERGLFQTPDRVILVTIDTLRADHVSAYGYPLSTTPFIDSLAAEGLLFRHAFAHAPVTGPSHASIFTGLYPLQHGVEANGQKLDQRFNTLAEAMAAAGYRTAAFVSTNAHFRWADFSQGFEIYDEQPILSKKKRGKRTRKYRPANRTVDAALEWLARLPSDERLFVWIHLYDPHKGLNPPKRHLAKIRHEIERLGRAEHLAHLRDAHGQMTVSLYDQIQRYDAEIRFADSELERLYQSMSREESNDLWIITSDHGQGLGSHDGWFGHLRQIYNTQLRVPLIFHATDSSLQVGIVEKQLVELVDLVPTLGEIVGFDFNQELGQGRGVSLVPLLSGGRQPRPNQLSFAQGTIYKQSLRRKARLKPKYTLQSLESKYILNEGKEDEFYEVDVDPFERSNRVDDPDVDSVRSRMQELLVTMIETLPSPEFEVEEVDDETKERLKALGYLQ